MDDMDASEVFCDSGEISLEQLGTMTGIDIGCAADIMRFKQQLISQYDRRQALFGNVKISEGQMCSEPHNEPPTIIDPVMNNEATIVIDERLIYAVFANNLEIVGNLIKQLDDIPKDGVLNVIIELGMSDLNYFIMESGIMISNLIRRAPCKKVFNFGAQVSIADLAIAMCCDDVIVSDFASVSITKADNGEGVSRYMVPVYKYLVMTTYKHWIVRGLFTRDEVEGLFSSEADNSIQLLSDEIRTRLEKKTT